MFFVISQVLSQEYGRNNREDREQLYRRGGQRTKLREIIQKLERVSTIRRELNGPDIHINSAEARETLKTAMVECQGVDISREVDGYVATWLKTWHELYAKPYAHVADEMQRTAAVKIDQEISKARTHSQ